MSKISVFISYSRQDEYEKDELISHLGVLQQEGLIDTWVDDQIDAGQDWASEVDQAIERAGVAVLLITKNFLSSKFMLQGEVARLLERHQSNRLIIFPVIAQECAWRNVNWLARMKVRPRSEKAIWRDGGRYADADLAAIAGEIANILAKPVQARQRPTALNGGPAGGSRISQDNQPTGPVNVVTQTVAVEVDYERALDLLKAQLERTNRFAEFTTLEARLRENLKDERLFGPNETNRSERARVIYSFNRLSMETLRLSFVDLARGQVPNTGQAPVDELSLVRKLKVTPTPAKIKPPVQTLLQDLPFNELTWEQFEALCAALIEAQPVTINCHLYGVQGDDQQGIDVVATQRGSADNETWAYQCKRYKDYTAGQLKKAVGKMAYPADYYVLMLSIPATAAVRRVADENGTIFLWDAKDIARKLKNYPVIVEDFFGAAWREAFCV
jgi:hypothetical protein